MSEAIYSLRKCSHDDMEAIIKLRVEFLKEARLVKNKKDVNELKNEIRDFVTEHLNKDLHFWFAEVENEAVAAGAVSIWDKLPVKAGSNYKVAYFSNMYTCPEYRKMGIASSLMKHIFGFLKEEGVQKAMLHALEDGKGVYKKLGFSSHENLMEMEI
ncbi:MAG TPA: GNAT family N-acetyltransferase [Clostridia bacterium]